MRLHWRQYDTGWGELLCFVLAWVIGLAAVWFDYAGRSQSRGSARVAVSGARRAAHADLD